MFLWWSSTKIVRQKQKKKKKKKKKKNMAARGRGLFSLSIYIENLKKFFL